MSGLERLSVHNIFGSLKLYKAGYDSKEKAYKKASIERARARAVAEGRGPKSKPLNPAWLYSASAGTITWHRTMTMASGGNVTALSMNHRVALSNQGYLRFRSGDVMWLCSSKRPDLVPAEIPFPEEGGSNEC